MRVSEGKECRRDDNGELCLLDGPGLGDGDRLDGPGLGDGDRLDGPGLGDGDRLDGPGLGDGDRLLGPGLGVGDVPGKLDESWGMDCLTLDIGSRS